MDNGLLSDVQWGFTPGESTRIALLSLIYNVRMAEMEMTSMPNWTCVFRLT